MARIDRHSRSCIPWIYILVHADQLGYPHLVLSTLAHGHLRIRDIYIIDNFTPFPWYPGVSLLRREEPEALPFTLPRGHPGLQSNRPSISAFCVGFAVFISVSNPHNHFLLVLVAFRVRNSLVRTR